MASAVDTPKKPHPILALFLFAVSGVLWAIAIFNIVKIFAKGYTYACTGQGCPYQTPAVAHELNWIGGTIPFAVITLVLAILAMTFRSQGKLKGPTSWDQVPLASGGGWATGVPASLQPIAPAIAAGTGVAVGGNPLAATTDLQSAERLRTSGLDGQATIAAMHDLGMSAGGYRMYDMDLAVSVPGRPSFHVRQAMFVPQSAIAMLFQGGTFPVKVDPTDQNKVLVELPFGS